MKKQFAKIVTLIAMLSLLTGTGSPATVAPAAPATPWEDKVDAWVLATSAEGETEFLVFMFEQADLSPAAALGTKSEKGAFVYETLTEVATRTQKPIRATLDALGVEYRPYWAANMIWVRAESSIIRAMAQRSDVAHVYANPSVRFSEPEKTPLDSAPQAVDGIEWNISKINAPAVWSLGYSGQGVLIGGQDTGYDWDHPALKDQYHGWDGVSASHDYNWHDTVTSGGGSCGANSPEPCDDHGHGTHTMGIMIGDDGGSYQIGTAPGAKWIGCRNMNVGVGTPASYTECYQWFIAPTRVDGSDPRPDLAPDVINNSWGCPASEGCNAESLRTVVQSVHAAGIVTTHSAGNDGYSGCGSINTPAAIYAESFTVGATDSGDNIASFSSRGPVTVEGRNLFKPNISAPGVSIRSSYRGGGYTSMGGTSMAAPHVAGVVALLFSANPDLIGQVDEVETLIEQTAIPRYTNDGCGSDTGSSHPNHTYGWGRIDAWAALRDAMHFFYIPFITK